MMKYVAFALAVAAAFALAPYALNGVPAGLTLQTALAHLPLHVGAALGVLLVGSLGLLYRPDRFAGLVLATAAAAIFYFKGLT